LWPKAAIIGIRPERQLSGDKLPPLGTAYDEMATLLLLVEEEQGLYCHF